jgi:nucleotide-binding universal stress UspA family protein
MFKNILLAVDGSSHAMHAAEVAADLARQGRATLRIVTVYDPVPLYIGEPNLQHEDSW